MTESTDPSDPSGASNPSPTPLDRRARFRRVLLRLAAVFAALSALCFGLDRGLTAYFDPRRGNEPDHVVVLSASWCPTCKVLKQALNEARMPYAEIDVERDWKTAYAFQATASRGVPVVIVGRDKVRGGLVRQLRAIQQACAHTQAPTGPDCDRLGAIAARLGG